MAQTYLTAREIQSLKPDPEKRQELAAGVVPGLYFVVQPTGKKSWAFRYRWKGLSKKLTLGRYPSMSLAGARDRAGEYAGMLPAGPGSGPSQGRRAAA